MHSTRRAMLQNIELMPQYQDFGFQSPSRLEAVAQHADEKDQLQSFSDHVLIRCQPRIVLRRGAMGLETLQEAPVFLHYTKAELDRNFDQRGWIPNAVEIIARHIERSRRTREKLTFISDLRYGPHPDELLDYFP